MTAQARTWRQRIRESLEALPVGRRSVSTTFEGGFLLARAMSDPGHLLAQPAHLRHSLELLFEVPAR